MTSALGRSVSNPALQLPTPPSGWPIGSYPTYAQAQHAVDFLSDEEFPVQDVTIVGVDLMQVERVLGRLNWQKVIAGGIASGAWLGVFIGLLLGIFTGGFLSPLLVGIGMGVVFGLVSTALPFAATKGTRDFTSSMQLVAGRYDVLCDPKTADNAKSVLAQLAMK